MQKKLKITRNTSDSTNRRSTGPRECDDENRLRRGQSSLDLYESKRDKYNIYSRFQDGKSSKAHIQRYSQISKVLE